MLAHLKKTTMYVRNSVIGPIQFVENIHSSAVKSYTEHITKNPIDIHFTNSFHCAVIKPHWIKGLERGVFNYIAQ